MFTDVSPVALDHRVEEDEDSNGEVEEKEIDGPAVSTRPIRSVITYIR